jgi:hypothetical protein
LMAQWTPCGRRACLFNWHSHSIWQNVIVLWFPSCSISFLTHLFLWYILWWMFCVQIFKKKGFLASSIISSVKKSSKNTLKYYLSHFWGVSVLIFWQLLLYYIPKENHVLFTPYMFPDT